MKRFRVKARIKRRNAPQSSRRQIVYRGQTLIELIIAMFVIIVGLSAAGELIFSNARAEERSANAVMATNLAREGVELAKAVRDSNWISGGATPFDLGLASGTDYTGVPLMNGGTFTGFDFIPNLVADADAAIKRSTNAGSPELYVQGTGVTGNATIFSRIITFYPICSDFNYRGSGTTCAPLQKIGVKVSVLVRWTQQDGSHSTTVEDELYDWR